MLQFARIFLLVCVPCCIAFQTLKFPLKSPRSTENSDTLARRRNHFCTGLFTGSDDLAEWNTQANNNINATTPSNSTNNDITRRSLLAGFGLAAPLVLGQEPSSAALNFGAGNRGKQSRIFFVSPDKNASDSLQSEQVDLDAFTLNSEICLLKLLPVKNPVFRGLERSVVGLSSLKSALCK